MSPSRARLMMTSCLFHSSIVSANDALGAIETSAPPASSASARTGARCGSGSTSSAFMPAPARRRAWRTRGGAAAHVVDQLVAVHARHLEVGDDDVEGGLGQPGHRVGAVARRGDVEAGFLEHLADESTHA